MMMTTSYAYRAANVFFREDDERTDSRRRKRRTIFARLTIHSPSAQVDLTLYDARAMQFALRPVVSRQRENADVGR